MAKARKKPPKPGRYDREPYESYASWPYVNASALCEAMDPRMVPEAVERFYAKRMKAYLDGKFKGEETPALRFGKAFHCRLLEPRLFSKEWKVAERCTNEKDGVRCPNPGKRLTAEGAWVCGVHGRNLDEVKDSITQEDGERIEAMRAACMAHDQIAAIRKFPGAETSLVFDVRGVRCKARLDKLVTTPKGSVILDVKTFGRGDFTPEAFDRQAKSLLYYVKAAFYIDAVKIALGVDASFRWIAVESDEPFEAAYCRPAPDMIAHGRYRYIEAMKKYQRCRAERKWPGAFPGVVDVGFNDYETERVTGGKEVYELPTE